MIFCTLIWVKKMTETKTNRVYGLMTHTHMVQPNGTSHQFALGPIYKCAHACSAVLH